MLLITHGAAGDGSHLKQVIRKCIETLNYETPVFGRGSEGEGGWRRSIQMKDSLEACTNLLERSISQIDVHAQNNWHDGTRPSIMVEA
jgi:hypothetical protein